MPRVALSVRSRVNTRSSVSGTTTGRPSSFFSTPSCSAMCRRFATRPTIPRSTSAISSRNRAISASLTGIPPQDVGSGADAWGIERISRTLRTAREKRFRLFPYASRPASGPLPAVRRQGPSFA